MTWPIRPTPPPAELNPTFPAIHAGLLGLTWEDDGDTLAAAIGAYRLAILRPDPHLLARTPPGHFPLWNALIEVEVPGSRWEPPSTVELCTIGPYHYPEDALASILLRAADILTREADDEAYMDGLLRLADAARDADEAAGVYDR